MTRHCQWILQRGYCQRAATRLVLLEPTERGYATVEAEFCTVHSRFAEDGRCAEYDWLSTDVLPARQAGAA